MASQGERVEQLLHRVAYADVMRQMALEKVGHVTQQVLRQ